MNNSSTYRQIFKATSIFGGVQFFSIIISVLRAKFIAILLGSTGIGIMSLLQSGLDIIGSVTNLGLTTSAVRDISEASDSHDEEKISRIVTSFKRLLWITGLLGSASVLLLSSKLSMWVFGNSNYSWAFAILSVTLLIDAHSHGKYSLLQALRKTKLMAKGSIIGGALGLIFSLPIYYFWGIKGIVPAILLASLTGFTVNLYFSIKIRIPSANVTYKTSLNDGKKMVKLGILITASSFISMVSNYFITIYISRTGSLSDLGLYQSGFSIANKYVEIVFFSIIADFYPRLAGINSDNNKVRELVNQQTELSLLIISPILVLLLSTTPIVIQLFYTKSFLPTLPYMQWVALGLVFRALSWTMGYIVLAKGDSVLYFIKELIMNIINLGCCFLGYRLFGLEGLGIAFLASNILLYTFVFLIVHSKYNYSLSKECIKVFLTQFTVCLISFGFAKFLGFPFGYISGTVLCIISAYYSYHILNKRIDINSFIRNKISKHTNNG
jgi:O-antigen/teichoic acid export membrane protein